MNGGDSINFPGTASAEHELVPTENVYCPHFRDPSLRRGDGLLGPS